MAGVIDAPIFDPIAFRLDGEQADLIARVRHLAAERFAPRAAQHDRDASFPTENYRDLHAAGLLAVCIPREHGGLGADYLTYALAAAEVARYCGATALTWNMHVCSTLWAGTLADDLDMDAPMRTEHARRRALHFRRIVADGAIYAQPFSEGNASAVGAIPFGTVASPVDGGWKVTGRKVFASLSGHANYYGVLCTEVTGDDRASRRNTLYLAIPANAAGVSVTGDWDPLGMRGTVSRTLEFAEVFVEHDAALMPRGVYFQAASRWPHMFLTLTPTYLGLAQAAYDFTVGYLRGGRRSSVVKQLAVAEMRIKLEQTKALWFQAVSEAHVDPTPEQRLRAYAAQFTTMETANDLARLAIRTCGGHSMLRSLPLERIYRDSRCGSLMAPWTAEVCLERIGHGALYNDGETDAMNLADLIDRNAAFTPDKPALRFAGQAWSYAAFAGRIGALARALKSQLGVRRGDRVAVLAMNHADHLTLLYACARLGAMLVPLNWRLAVPELTFILSNADVRALFVAEAFGASIATTETQLVGLDYTPERGVALTDLLAADSGDGSEANVDWHTPLLIVYTAGTTGRPKGAVLAQQALLANAMMSQHLHAMTSDDHVLTVLPLFHVGGLNIQTTPALQLGATVTMHARFTAEDTLCSIAQDRPTLTVLVPSAIQALLEHPRWSETDLGSLRAISTGSTLVPQGLVDAVQARGVPVLQVYGATETSPIAVYTRLGGDLSRPLSTGLPGLLCEARIVDDAGYEVPPGMSGEVEVRGPNVLTEYWRNGDATAEALHDGWFRTGDIAMRDDDGYFTIHDRKKNMIVSGGENIYPAEIERVLLEHPMVVEAAVIGAPDPRWQEVPVAFVVSRAVVPAEELRAFLAASLARFKVPRDIVFLGELPRNALGKVQHFRLKESWRGIGSSPVMTIGGNRLKR